MEPHVRDRDHRALMAVGVVFLTNGAAIASWVPHVPHVQAALALTPSTLGLALLAMGAGAIVAMPLAGRAIGWVGSRRVLLVAASGFFAALVLPVMAPTLPALVGALAFLGASNGATDVAMNAQAAAIEARLGRPVMSRLHGAWSVGGVVGASLAAAALYAGITPPAHVLGAAMGLGSAALVAVTWLLGQDADLARSTGARRGPTWRVVVLGGAALLALLAEGSMADWSAVWIRHALAASADTAALGFAAFSFAMAVGRLGGDRLVARWGAHGVSTCALIGALGLAVGLVAGDPLIAIVSCFCVGLGVANLVPVIFRAAAQSGDGAGEGIATVATAGYFGFLAGPPVIGFVAEASSLPIALGLVVVILGGLAWLAGRLGL